MTERGENEKGKEKIKKTIEKQREDKERQREREVCVQKSIFFGVIDAVAVSRALEELSFIHISILIHITSISFLRWRSRRHRWK